MREPGVKWAWNVGTARPTKPMTMESLTECGLSRSNGTSERVDGHAKRRGKLRVRRDPVLIEGLAQHGHGDRRLFDEDCRHHRERFDQGGLGMLRAGTR